MQVRDDRLDLDDEDKTLCGLKREDIDRSAFISDLERDLDLNDPARRSQHRRRLLHERGVIRIDAYLGVTGPLG